MLCYCDFMWKEMRNCRVGGAETMRLPFDCPMDHVFVISLAARTAGLTDRRFGCGGKDKRACRLMRLALDWMLLASSGHAQMV
jgi:hypothetical protein